MHEPMVLCCWTQAARWIFSTSKYFTGPMGSASGRVGRGQSSTEALTVREECCIWCISCCKVENTSIHNSNIHTSNLSHCNAGESAGFVTASPLFYRASKIACKVGFLSRMQLILSSSIALLLPNNKCSYERQVYFPMQAPVVLDHDVLSQLMQTPWTTKAILTCELSKPQEEACQQLAGLSSASTAVMSQVLHHLTHSACCVETLRSAAHIGG